MAGLYLHIPFCERKCIYCDFYSIERLEGIDFFIENLKKEIAGSQALGRGHEFETIFFGGGTPSLLEPRILRALLEGLRTSFHVTSDAEVTIEANPGTVDRQKLRAYLELGINRVSFGVQSFHDDELEFLGRIHSAGEAIESVRSARDVGYENISLDLIFALPGQSMGRWRDTLRRAVELETQHLSAYSLIVEQRTPLASMVRARQVTPLPVEEDAAMYEETMEILGSAGFEHYEVSNYARPGYRSRHNSNYWNHSFYLGFGPSAHSFWENRRWWNISNLQSYNQLVQKGQSPVAGEETLGPGQLVDESVMLGLRSDGLDLRRLEERLGVNLLSKGKYRLEQYLADRLVSIDNNILRVTRRGYLYCDQISTELLACL